MNVCCLYCGCENMAVGSPVTVLDEEINQILKSRGYKCTHCHKAGTLTWWEVWVNGKTLISPVSGFQWEAE